tara:strand:- start:301 stop:492 length:192 start_codon:yes stop_codon:yes gene_type:complete
MHNKDNMLEGLSKKRNLTTLTRRPLSEMEMVDLMIYGEDVVSGMIDQGNTKSLTSNKLRKQNV